MIESGARISPPLDHPIIDRWCWPGAFVYRIGSNVLISEQSGGPRVRDGKLSPWMIGYADKLMLMELSKLLPDRLRARVVETEYLGVSHTGERIYRQPYLRPWGGIERPSRMSDWSEAKRQEYNTGIEHRIRTVLFYDPNYTEFRHALALCVAELRRLHPSISIDPDIPGENDAKLISTEDILERANGEWVLCDPVQAHIPKAAHEEFWQSVGM